MPGNKDFDLFVVISGSAGSLSARVTMTEYLKDGTPTGNVGTELMSGSQTGFEVYLDGYAWEAGAPSNWTLDEFFLTVSPDGNRMDGRYRCKTCTYDGSLSLVRY